MLPSFTRSQKVRGWQLNEAQNRKKEKGDAIDPVSVNTTAMS
jgi:hypothetical protein